MQVDRHQPWTGTPDQVRTGPGCFGDALHMLLSYPIIVLDLCGGNGVGVFGVVGGVRTGSGCFGDALHMRLSYPSIS